MNNNVALNGRARGALSMFIALVLVFLYTPMILLVIFSFNDSTIVAFPLASFTTRWYTDMLSNQELIAALGVSIRVAFVAATGTELIALIASIAVARRSFRGKSAMMALFLAPMLIPALAIGVSLLLLFHVLTISLSIATIALGHMVIAFPYALLVLLPRVQNLDRVLEEAATDLGATAWQSFRMIVLPLIAPGVISSFLVVFTVSFDEYAVASFLNGTDETLPIYIFNLFKEPELLPQIIGVAVVIMFASVVLIAASEVGRRLAEARLVGKNAVA